MMPTAIQSPSTPPLSCDLSALFDIVERVESLPEEACGAFLFTDRDAKKGMIYIERGRLCWAVVRGMGRRLTDLVLREASRDISLENIEALYQSCRVEGRPWGQTLVEQGIVDPDGLRTALARHTAEGLSAITGFRQASCSWLDKGDASYDAMFTFDAAEMGALIGGLRHKGWQPVAFDELRRLVPPNTFAAAYVWPESNGDHLPIAIVGSVDRSLTTAIDLGKWAHNELQLGQAVSRGCSPVTAITAAGQAIVTWTSEFGYCAAVCESFPILARTLSNMSRAQPLRAT